MARAVPYFLVDQPCEPEGIRGNRVREGDRGGIGANGKSTTPVDQTKEPKRGIERQRCRVRPATNQTQRSDPKMNHVRTAAALAVLLAIPALAQSDAKSTFEHLKA